MKLPLLVLSLSLTISSGRSEEHTSELQSQSNLVCRLLLEKKNTHRSGQRVEPFRAVERDPSERPFTANQNVRHCRSNSRPTISCMIWLMPSRLECICRCL